MQKTLLVLLALALSLSAAVTTGCKREAASGKLQIMYSGNIRGNVSPCG